MKPEDLSLWELVAGPAMAAAGAALAAVWGFFRWFMARHFIRVDSIATDVAQLKTDSAVQSALSEEVRSELHRIRERLDDVYRSMPKRNGD